MCEDHYFLPSLVFQHTPLPFFFRDVILFIGSKTRPFPLRSWQIGNNLAY